MADPETSPDLAATRLKPADWTAASGTASQATLTSSSPPRRRGRWLALPWLLLLALLAALVAWILSGAGIGGFGLPGTPPRPSAPPPAAAPPASPPAIESELEALKSRLAMLETAQAVPPTATPPAAAASMGVAQRLEAAEEEIRRLAEAGRKTDARIDALIADLDAVGATSGPAATAMARARDFFVLLGARRHVEGGRPLGALEPALSQQFAGREPAAVAALLAWSRAPVSQDLLAEALLEPPASRATEPEADGMLARLWQGLKGLVELRRADAESADRARERAGRALARGDLSTALAIIDAAPAGTAPTGWKEDVRRLSSALDGLERLELIALQDASAAVPSPQPASVLSATDPARP